MTYYAVSDIHGFYTQAADALRKAGFFDDSDSKLILCGDALDRGSEACETIKFLVELLENDRLIYIRGNHEDLMVSMLQFIARGGDMYSFNAYHHHSNGTYDTALQIAGMDENTAYANPMRLVNSVMASDFYKKLLPATVDYFEMDQYIFVHGYIPCKKSARTEKLSYLKDWRSSDDWEAARWINGIDAACVYKVTEPDKTIVCGHWHCSYGHKLMGKTKTDYGNDSDFSPFRSEGLIAIDACTAFSGTVNVLKFETE